MHTNINTYTSYYTCNSNINIPIHNSFIVASVLHSVHIIARCKETTKHPCYKHYVGHCPLSKMQYIWHTQCFNSWLYDYLHVTCGHYTDIPCFFIIVTLMVTFGIKPKTFPSSYHMSLAVIPVPQVQFQPSPLIWKKKISKLYLCNGNQLPKNGSNVNSQNVV